MEIMNTPISNAAFFNDLNSFIRFLKNKNELIVIDKEVKSKYEAAAVQMEILRQTGKAVLFTNIDGKGYKMLGNIYTSRKMLAYMFDVEPEKLANKVMSFEHSNHLPVEFVKDAPCQQVVNKDFKNIRDVVPIPWNYKMDASYYITAGIVVTKDPHDGKISTAICRIMYKDGRKLNIFFAPMQNNWKIFNKYKEIGKDMPIAIIIGADPIMMFASESSIPYSENKFEYAGAMRGKSMEVVKCLTVDHYVPAHAQFILEAIVSATETSMEGPMGENQRVYGPKSDQPVVTVTCITHQKVPIYQNILPGTIEEQALIAIPMEGRILSGLQKSFPNIVTLNLLPNFMRCVVQIDNFFPVQRGLGKNILMATLSEPFIKHAVVVDKDVDINEADEVNWAILTRSHLPEDLLIVERSWGFVMDPSRKDKTDPVTKIGIDASVDPLEKEKYLKSDTIGRENINIDEYISH